jgi:hypothetical protein
MLDSAVLEQFITSEVWQDRQLGGNITLELNNEVDISLSANIGLKYTPDIFFRARPINLFYGEENPNDRVYVRTDLWGYIRNHRAKILSAIYSLIKSWVDANCPKSSIPFTSFPEWSRVVGGIMEYHGFLNPCVLIDDEDIGGDDETKSMKALYKLMAEYAHNHQEKKGFTINEIRTIIMEAQSIEAFEGFSEWDLNSNRNDQSKLGKLIKRFVGRSFTCKSDILQDNTQVHLIIVSENIRSARTLLQFRADKPILKKPIINDTNDEIPHYPEERIDEDIPMSKPKMYNYDIEGKISLKSKLVDILMDNGGRMAEDLLIAIHGIPELIIDIAKKEGLIYSPKPGFCELMNVFSR